MGTIWQKGKGKVKEQVGTVGHVGKGKGKGREVQVGTIWQKGKGKVKEQVGTVCQEGKGKVKEGRYRWEQYGREVKER